MGKGGSSSSRQEIQLSPEAQQLVSHELQMFLETFLPAQGMAQGDVLRGLGPFLRETGGAQATEAATGLARRATREAGAQADLTPRAITKALESIEAEDPMMLDQLRNLFAGMAMQEGALVDPRFAQFLRPDVTTIGSSSPGSGQQVAQGLGTAIAAAGLIAALAAT